MVLGVQYTFHQNKGSILFEFEQSETGKTVNSVEFESGEPCQLPVLTNLTDVSLRQANKRHRWLISYFLKIC